MAAKGTPATLLLSRQKVRHRVYEYEPDLNTDSWGEYAAAALGLPTERVFKTLVARVDGALAVGVVPVSGSLDLKSLAAALGGKRGAMADPADAERSTGYVRGGISPLGQRRALPTIVDSSAVPFETVFVSAGRRGLQVELAPADLVRLAKASVAAIRSA